jgi:hypothetical protein
MQAYRWTQQYTGKMMTEATETALQEIDSLITTRKYSSFALRVEILKPNHFVTACIIFGDEAVKDSHQEFLDYPHALLACFKSATLRCGVISQLV